MSISGPLVDVIAGARPNFMKLAPILRAVKANPEATSRLRVRHDAAGRIGQRIDPTARVKLKWRKMRRGPTDLRQDSGARAST